MSIKAPFNFVPLEDTVFFPSWRNKISQDVPFIDSVSGSIDISIEAMTPIFVRNGILQLSATEKNAIIEEKKKYNGKLVTPELIKIEKLRNSFSHTEDGRYFIPGTSIKGELRSVLEILSFGKMTQVQDARFGIRDLNDTNYRAAVSQPHCGWLYKDGDNYFIDDCGKPLRIEPQDIDKHFQTSLARFGREIKGNADDSEKSASEKYKKVGVLKDKSVDFNRLHKEFSHSYTTGDGRIVYAIQKNGTVSGTIVLTGQPGARKNDAGTGKLYEFIFLDSNIKTLPVVNEVFENFKTVHCRNYDYMNLWESNLMRGIKIPVFFTLKNEGRTNQFVEAIGLSYMFRYPSRKSIYAAIPEDFRNKSKDMAECIFGTVDKGQELKGRITVSPAWLIGSPQILGQVNTTLSSPKPSYAPLYVEQGSWMSPDARIKGRKRYPVRNKPWNNTQGTQNTETSFCPLKEGSIFNGKIYFHNLKEAELGAIVAALTFIGHDECFHSIGEAKPLGYGKVKISIQKLNIDSTVSDNSKECSGYMDSFRTCIENEYLKDGRDIEETSSVSELIRMATGIPAGMDNKFEYMLMSTTRTNNEFLTAKKNNLNLPKFSDILSGIDSIEIISGKKYQIDFLSSVENENALKNAEIEAIRIEKETEETRKKEAIISNFLNKIKGLLEKQSYKEAILACQEAYESTGCTKFVEKEKEIKDFETVNEFRAAKAEADSLYEKGDYKVAQESYEKALKLKDDPAVHELIEKCSKMIENDKKISQGIDGFLPTKLNSIKAYTEKLDKWKAACNIDEISDEDKDKIIGNINSHFGDLKNADKRSWRENAPQRLEKYLGKKVSELKFE